MNRLKMGLEHISNFVANEDSVFNNKLLVVGLTERLMDIFRPLKIGGFYGDYRKRDLGYNK